MLNGMRVWRLMDGPTTHSSVDSSSARVEMPIIEESDTRPAVMAPSVAKNVTIDRSLLLCAAGRAPSDVAFLLMQQRAADTKKPDAAAQASLFVTWSLQNQANIRGKWNIV